MTEQQRNINGLLAVTAARLLQCGEMVQQMRGLQRDGADEKYWRMANELAQHLAVAGHCLTESHRGVLAKSGHAIAGIVGGGLLN